jgi:peroxiredoxin
MKKSRIIAAVCGIGSLVALGGCEGNGSATAGASPSSSMTVPAVDTVSGSRTAVVGRTAPNFTLNDLDGGQHTLSNYTDQGKIVVLEWFNPRCPFVVKHYRDGQNQTMNELADKYEGDGVVWLRINSGAPGLQGHGMELNREIKRNWDMDTPILVDETGTVGRAYGAKRTPEMYIINANGTLVYHGAIDNDSTPGAPGDVNYVDQALNDVLNGRDVRTPTTNAYGCSVKYASN